VRFVRLQTACNLPQPVDAAAAAAAAQAMRMNRLLLSLPS